MENEKALLFDGNSARPSQVRVLLFNRSVHIHDSEDDRFIQSFPLEGAAYNEAGNSHYLYLDQGGLQYLQFTSAHPVVPDLIQQLEDANTGWYHRLMKQKTVILVPAVLLLATGLYFLLVTLIPILGSKIIGVEQEIKMGNKLKEVMLQQEELLGAEIDTVGTRHLQAFADRLKLSQQYPIRLTLVKSKMVNAYALPGGQIVVYTGILEKIKTPEALAALLAHESTHVNERHSLRSLLRSAANGIIISVLFSDATGISGALASNAEALNGLRYSRSLETEADEKGMDLLLANNVNLDGMRQLMRSLQEIGGMPNSLSFLSTHPLTKNRIRSADHYIKKHPQEKDTRDDLKTLFEKLK